MNRSSYKNILFVFIFMFLGKIVGAIYKIPLTGILGAEGIGMYQLIFPLFVLSMTIASSGASLAVTKLVAEGKYNNNRIFLEALKYAVISSVIIFVIFIIFSKKISILQGSKEIYRVYYYAIFSVVIISVLAIYRGYFRGVQDIKTYSLSEFLEQIFKLVFGLIFSKILLRYGVIYSVIGAFIGIIFASLISLFYCIIKKKKYRCINSSLIFDRKQFYNYSFFATLSSIVIPMSQFFDSIIIVFLLNKTGYGTISTSLYGLLTGVVSVIINLPLSLILAVETVALPSLSKDDGFSKSSFDKIQEFLLITIAISLISSVCIYVFSDNIIEVLYGGLGAFEKNISSIILKYGSLSIFFAAIVQISSVIFQSRGKFYFPVITLLIGFVVKVIIELLLMPRIGIVGAEIALVFSYLLAALVNVIELRKMSLIGNNYKIFYVILLAMAFLFISAIIKQNLKDVFSDFILIVITGVILLTVTFIAFFTYLKLKRGKFILKKR